VTEQLQRLLDETRHEIDRADTKSSMLLGATAIAASVLVGGVVADNIRLDRTNGWAQVLAVISVSLFAAAIGLLGSAVFPRIGKAVPGRADYFMDHIQYPTVDALIEAVKSSAPAQRHARQLSALAVVLVTKYKHLQLGSIAAGGALMVAAAAALVDRLG
jgi:Pycsar effector protein